jgi:hypothetical protein
MGHPARYAHSNTKSRRRLSKNDKGRHSTNWIRCLLNLLFAKNVPKHVLGTGNDANSKKERSDVSGDIEKPGHSAPVSEVGMCRGNTVPDHRARPGSAVAIPEHVSTSETGAEWPKIKTIAHGIIALFLFSLHPYPFGYRKLSGSGLGQPVTVTA